MTPFHRLFICRLCSRIVGGCLCRGVPRTEELVDSCAVCSSAAKEKK